VKANERERDLPGHSMREAEWDLRSQAGCQSLRLCSRDSVPESYKLHGKKLITICHKNCVCNRNYVHLKSYSEV
jgi:hypothetical protein